VPTDQPSDATSAEPRTPSPAETCAEPGGPEAAGFAAADLRLLLCRLSTYEQVLPSVTHRALLWAARSVPGVHTEVAYRPPDDGRPPRDDRPAAAWTGSGSGRPAREFDLLGITLTVPQEALNLPRLLRASGIPLGRAARAADPTCPLVVLGGHSAAVVPFLHGRVPGPGGDDEGLVDAVVVGDGLGALRELLEALREPAQRTADRPALLRRLAAGIPGLYVPSLTEHVQRAGRLVEVRALGDGLPFPTVRRDDPPEAWRGYDGAFIPWAEDAGEETLPVAFACPRRCRFCRDGWCAGPHRQTDPDLVVELAARLKASLAAVDLNLLSSDLGCQHDLLPLLARLLELYPRLSAKSLSGVSLVRSPMLPALLPRLGKRELTVGVEGISARLRTYLGKRFDPWTLPARIGLMAREGLRQLKLFFIATGLETEADLDELGRLLAAIRREAPRLRLLVSQMPLFPAPGTPLGFAPLRPLEPSCRAIADTARSAGVEVRLSAGTAEIRALALLTRAGRAGTPTLVRASLEHRITFDADVREGDAAELERLLAADGLDLGRLAGELPARAPLPWDDIDLGVPRRKLHREYERACAEFEGTVEPTAEDELDDAAPAAPRSRTSVPPAPPALLRDLPDPFVGRTRAGLAFAVRPPAAERPVATLARGALREWFLADDGAARAFAGLVEVLGVPGTAGLRLAVVEFREGFAPRLPAGPRGAAGARPAEPRALLDRLPERPWFLAVGPDEGRFAALRAIVAALHPAPRHRVERIAGGRRLLVDKGFWNRCGLAAAHVADGELRLILAPAAGPIVRALAASWGPPTVTAVLAADDAARCPTCRSPALTRLLAADPLPALVCPACGPTAPGPATRA
jgi:radical SAM superfamily enzyme YgiQ (UPF0313 family)